ncbi:AmmeMemoRadiSam system radical SAM enzyme [Patescibacteria group bacterium]|nr:AmmeMemoRadiSam system radical SAM enzyme [Patescibacteria group bacterium]MBU4274751.1 AmmeMemoRadiSam system radical SAM enzyme [Patescibacteria group bacterium]MBU4368066.1 AmmeMemoRadiSam system radical SAM enzyme [Patescibacteria group bacterium]MBU4462295.1 AmmeMemoRadiSam system radical SAM enzyme [Patescibacteria group bacterium]MCG2700344.1 AmmeMemoRadiSam system radical SAM enzyme [Candidatus Parcubacteria bacterium]
MKEAYLYKKLKNETSQCQTCAHYCVLKNGEIGLCGVRKNNNGKIYSLVYGRACAVNIDPIEKKPFFHFLSGTKSLSIATVGCNFSCKNCQNWNISQGPKLTGKIEGENVSPEEIVEKAKQYKVPSISYTYTDPAVFLEYALDTMKLAKKAKLKNTWVTNGFLSKETLNLISSYLDATNVDLKGFTENFYKKYCAGRLQPVLDTLKRMKKAKIWIEITTLVIPTLNDDEKTFKNIANFIKKELGPETPWHITQFCGAISWKLQNLPNTSVETLKKAYEIGKKVGLKYVYTGNIAGMESEDTYCPKCKTKMIERLGYLITRYDRNGKCSKCGESLNIIE